MLEALEDNLIKPADNIFRSLEKRVAEAFRSTPTEKPAAKLVTGDAPNEEPYVRIKEVEARPAARLVIEPTPAGARKPSVALLGKLEQRISAAQQDLEDLLAQQEAATGVPARALPVEAKPANAAKAPSGGQGGLQQRITDAQKNLENILLPGNSQQGAPAGGTIEDGDSARPGTATEGPAEATGPAAAAAARQGPSDQQIADQISKQLHAWKAEGLLKGFGMRLHVKQGIIRLSGRVAAPEDRQMISDLASSTYGVRQVLNELELVAPSASGSVSTAVATEPPGQLPAVTDNQIAMMISSQLKAKKADGTLTNFSLQMTVRDGKVWLQGYVPSRSQRDKAIAIARNARGVSEVVNEIDIQLPITRDIAAMVPQALRPQALRSQGQQPKQMAAQLAQVPVAMAAALAAAPAQMASGPSGISRARYEQPQVPNYAWPSYAAHPNYGAVTYPKQYSPSAWPYIGPFYPYPQVPLGWRKVTLEWDDGWWFLDFSSRR